jgi:hypothetical protein
MKADVARRSEAAAADEEESLKDALQQTLDEARMVLPGVQALFGFQLIAVFSDGFLATASHLVSGAMLPLAAGLALDIHLVASAVTRERSLAIATGAVVFAMFVALWFAFPQWRAAQARLRKR